MIIEIDPKVDVVFHNLFGSPEHPRLTRSFINSLLVRIGLPPAVELTICNPFQLASFINQKESELDILYRDAEQRQIQLEMQIVSHSGLAQRMLHNWTQLYQRQLVKGQDYTEHIPVVSLWILDNCLFHDRQWLHVFRCCDYKSGLVLHQDQCLVTVELPVWLKALDAYRDKPLDLLDKWLYFLTRAKGSKAEKLFSVLPDPEFEEAVELMSGFTKEQKRRHAYDRRENYERLVKAYIKTGQIDGRAEGKLEGKIEGKIEGKLEDAQLMLADGLTVEQVIKYTGLCRDDLEKAGLVDQP